MFATNHVAHTAYEHMCFQQRVALEESLAARHAEAALAAPAQSQTRYGLCRVYARVCVGTVLLRGGFN